MQRDLDKEFKKYLENFEATFQPQHWEKFERLLNHQNSLDQSFEQQIKEKLSSFKTSGSPDWSQFEKKLDDAIMPNQKIDIQVKAALSNYHAPFSSSSWSQLASDLEKAGNRRKLVGMKVAEAALIALIIFTFFKYLGRFDQPKQPAVSNYAVNEKVISEISTESNVATLFPDQIDGALIDVNSPDIVENIGSAEKNGSQFSAGVHSKNELSLAVSGENQTAIPGNARLKVNNREIKHSGNEGTFEDAFQFKDIYASEFPRSVSGKLDLLDNTISQIQVRNRTTVYGADFVPAVADASQAVAVVEYLDKLPDAFDIDYHHFPEILAAEPLKVIVNDKVSKIGMSTKINVHDVSTFNPQTLRWIDDLVTLSFAYGINHSVKNGRFGFDVGAYYEEMQFDGLFASNANDIKKLEIPAHIRFYALNSNFLQAYVKAGLNLNNVLLAKYDDASLASGASFGNSKEYSQGLFRDGFMKQNHFLSSSYGFGLEALISDNVYFFLEGLYQNHISGKGIGEFGSKFKSYSVQLGINYQIKALRKKT